MNWPMTITTADNIILDRNYYWPIVEGDELLMNMVPGYRCWRCRTTYFEAEPELLMRHDCAAERARKDA